MERPTVPTLIALAAGLAHAPRLSLGNAHQARAVFRCRRWGLTVAWVAALLGSPALRWA